VPGRPWRRSLRRRRKHRRQWGALTVALGPG
jgi:hypothetical protein